MKIYIASRWGRKAEMSGYAKRLTELGHTVTSEWVEETAMDQKADGSYAGGEWKPDPGYAANIARQDLSHIDEAQVVLVFTDVSREGYTGGRHVECGYALASGKYVLVVGPRTNPFHYLCGHYETFDDFVGHIALLGL